MRFLGKDISTIRRPDLDSLVRDEVAEGTTLDYKRAAWGNSDKDKREFLADVASFANTAGGIVLVGIEEEEGAASALCGILRAGMDALILRLQETMLHGLEPRLPGVEFVEVELDDTRSVLAMAIPRSFESPHRVTYKGSSRFWSRGSRGKYEMDVGQLRSAFLAQSEIGQRIRDFRIDRLFKVKGGETPVEITPGPYAVLHAIPLTVGATAGAADLAMLGTGEALPLLGGWSNANHRFNLDGYLFHTVLASEACPGYAQVFRSGAIEVVDTHWFEEEDVERGGTRRRLWVGHVPDVLNGCIRECLQLQSRLGVAPPIAICLSFLGVRGYCLTADVHYPSEHLIDRDDLIIPETIADGFDAPVRELVRPILDDVWRAGGWPGFRG